MLASSPLPTARLGAPTNATADATPAEDEAEPHPFAALASLRTSGEQPWVIGQIAAAGEGAAQVQLNNLKAH